MGRQGGGGAGEAVRGEARRGFSHHLLSFLKAGLGTGEGGGAGLGGARRGGGEARRGKVSAIIYSHF